MPLSNSSSSICVSKLRNDMICPKSISKSIWRLIDSNYLLSCRIQYTYPIHMHLGFGFLFDNKIWDESNSSRLLSKSKSPHFIVYEEYFSSWYVHECSLSQVWGVLLRLNTNNKYNLIHPDILTNYEWKIWYVWFNCHLYITKANRIMLQENTYNTTGTTVRNFLLRVSCLPLSICSHQVNLL